ncbi:unnamed protein product [Nippostrongylus brasiliensis]|uniref:CCHC-type domain-containing protein n=1 Tax=Nippostrongylus brasiliensis TaxID=27835 RepID=A0A0N4YY66_NIPBR|nr:unnamed protein product [Nippostrongylus brasiliensis]
MIDEFADDVFWERVINNRGANWSMTSKLLETLETQWTQHEANSTIIDVQWSEKKQQPDESGSTTIAHLLQRARHEQTLLNQIGSRIIAVILINAEEAQKTNFTTAQQEQRIRETITKMRKEQHKLRTVIQEIEARMTEIKEHDQQNAVRLAHEKDRLADQVQNLEREAQQLKEAKEEYEGFRNFWKNRAEERAAQIESLQQTVTELQRRIQELEGQQEAQRHQHVEVEHFEDLVEVDRIEDEEHDAEHQHEENAVRGRQQEAHQDNRAPQPDDRDRRSIRREIRRLEREISEIEEARRAIPARAHADLSRGIHPTMRCVFCERQGQHYSDACPIVTDVDDRRRIIERRRRCFRCLEHCERRGFCDYQEKRCIYCNRAARTVLREARRENGEHHAAICFVSIHREQAWIYEEQLRDRVAELEQRLRQH